MTRCLSFCALVALSGALQAQQITITNPVAGAQVPVGQQCAIAWTSQGLAPGTQLKIGVKVGGAGDQPVAAFVPAEAGQYQWLIPWACPTGSTCTVQIGLQDPSSKPGGTATSWSGTNFALVPNPEPALILHAPAGGEQWPLGATRSVSWEPHNLAGTLTIELLQGSKVVDTVSGIPVASNRFPYALPEQLPAGNDYTLRLTSDAAPLRVDGVKAPAILPLYPYSVVVGSFSKSLSIAAPGCNFQCEFCQNWQISQSPRAGSIIELQLCMPIRPVSGLRDHQLPLVGRQTIRDAERNHARVIQRRPGPGQCQYVRSQHADGLY